MSLKVDQEIVVISHKEDTPKFVNSVELVRRCSKEEKIETSWDNSCYVTYCEQLEDNPDKTPPFVSIMITDTGTPENKSSSSSQTDPALINYSIADVSLSFAKDFNINDSEHCFRVKRHRRGSSGDNRDIRPWKKTKCIDSCTSSTSDITDPKTSITFSTPLTSTSEMSFKSINSNHSFKVRKRRPKSESNLFRDALQKSRRTFSINKNSCKEDSRQGGMPRKEKSHRRSKTRAWQFVDLCAWIGRKGYQSISGLYSEMVREPMARKAAEESEELLALRKYLEEMDVKQTRLSQENQLLHDQMRKMMAKVDELEERLKRQETQVKAPPPSVPPPPPPPPPPPAMKLSRSHTLPRRSRERSPRIAGPRLTITPQDIANVKLRKTKDNPVRTKPAAKEPQPLVTQQMLMSTRARLGRARPVATSTPKQQLSELEKCLLQESSVATLYRRRGARSSFRNAEELRPRARLYPSTSRAPRSPRSPRPPRAPHAEPRSNSLPRGSQMPQLNFNACSVVK